VRPRHDGSPASSARSGTGRRRAGRSGTDRMDRARMPGRPALGRLDRIAYRRRVDPASGRVRLPQPLYDPRHSHRCPRAAAGHRDPGDGGRARSPGRDCENPLVLDSGATGTTRRVAMLAQADGKVVCGVVEDAPCDGERAGYAGGGDGRRKGHPDVVSALAVLREHLDHGRARFCQLRELARNRRARFPKRGSRRGGAVSRTTQRISLCWPTPQHVFDYLAPLACQPRDERAVYRSGPGSPPSLGSFSSARTVTPGWLATGTHMQMRAFSAQVAVHAHARREAPKTD